MSGIEAAGLALAVFPILIGGLGQMAEGIETIKRWKRYKLKLKEYASKLETARAYFSDTLKGLLIDLVPSDEDYELLVLEPLGSKWTDPVYEARLRDRLEQSYKSYMLIIQTLLNRVQTMCEKLGINSDGAIQWNNYSTVEREMKRFKLAFSERVYKHLLDDIDRANKDLRDFTHENISMEPGRKRRSKRPIKELKLIREHARSLYRVLMSEKTWKCECKRHHRASLRLEARPPVTATATTLASRKTVFRVWVNVANKPGHSIAKADWKELEIETSQEDLVLPAKPNRQPLSIHTTNAKKQTSKSVKFTAEFDEGALPEKNPAAAIQQCIDDMCSALCASNQSGRAIGFLIDEKIGRHQHQVYRADTISPPQPLSKSLEDLLKAERDVSSEGLSRRDRLQIAVTLASSVLQLDGTPWLKGNWSSGDILFHKSNNQSEAAEHWDPYLIWQTCCYNSETPAKRLQKYMGQCEALQALGLTLVELCFGRTLIDMRKPEDITRDEAATRLETAKRLHRRVEQEMGYEYGDVVRRCLTQPFDVRELSLENEDVQQHVLDGIVGPLVKDLKAFTGSDIGML